MPEFIPDSLHQKAKIQLSIHEAVRYLPYRDSENILTIGIGHNLEAKPLPRKVVDLLFEYDLYDAYSDAARWLGWKTYDNLSEVRKLVVIDMVFNLGYGKLLGFKKFRQALIDGDYEEAAEQMKDSLWCKQVKSRCTTLCSQMRNNQWSI